MKPRKSLKNREIEDVLQDGHIYPLKNYRREVWKNRIFLVVTYTALAILLWLFWGFLLHILGYRNKEISNEEAGKLLMEIKYNRCLLSADVDHSTCVKE